MKIACLFALLVLAPLNCFAQEDGAVEKVTTEIPGWGIAANPDGDCKFTVADDTLVITVPSSPLPRDLAAEIDRVNAPHVVVPVEGDFVFEIKTNGDFVPGGESNQPGRTGYAGAAIILMADPSNIITLARATLQTSRIAPHGYANFEMRNAGRLARIGVTTDHELPLQGPVICVWSGPDRSSKAPSAWMENSGTSSLQKICRRNGPRNSSSAWR